MAGNEPEVTKNEPEITLKRPKLTKNESEVTLNEPEMTRDEPEVTANNHIWPKMNIESKPRLSNSKSKVLLNIDPLWQIAC